ncbi:hypothetical protein ABIB82_007619 [Bradyrhizobium sp. i1.8.4]|uniref:hypothetical protein n=1 Tax=unclassified Bradyrhizobium TaxID=2631580 RepID=UPI003D1ECA37
MQPIVKIEPSPFDIELAERLRLSSPVAVARPISCDEEVLVARLDLAHVACIVRTPRIITIPIVRIFTGLAGG